MGLRASTVHPPSAWHLKRERLPCLLLPILLPQALNNLLGGSSPLSLVLQKTGLAEQITGIFGMVEILDDIIDHWDASQHVKERTHLLELLLVRAVQGEGAGRPSPPLGLGGKGGYVCVWGGGGGTGELQHTAGCGRIMLALKGSLPKAPCPHHDAVQPLPPRRDAWARTAVTCEVCMPGYGAISPAAMKPVCPMLGAGLCHFATLVLRERSAFAQAGM